MNEGINSFKTIAGKAEIKRLERMVDFDWSLARDFTTQSSLYKVPR